MNLLANKFREEVFKSRNVRKIKRFKDNFDYDKESLNLLLDKIIENDETIYVSSIGYDDNIGKFINYSDDYLEIELNEKGLEIMSEMEEPIVIFTMRCENSKVTHIYDIKLLDYSHFTLKK